MNEYTKISHVLLLVLVQLSRFLDSRGTPSGQPWLETWELFEKTSAAEQLMNVWKMTTNNSSFVTACSAVPGAPDAPVAVDGEAPLSFLPRPFASTPGGMVCV